MPQMKPMNWIFLFIFMMTTIMFLNINNYYFKNNKLSENKKNLFKPLKNWVW